jgi:hypothetical protein
VEHVDAFVIGEGHVLELDLAARVGQRHGVGRIDHVGLGVEHREDLLHGRHRRLEGVVELRELLHRVEEAAQVGGEGDEHADLQRRLRNQVAAVPEHDDHAERREELDEREVEAALHDRLHVHVTVLGVARAQLFVVRRFAAEGEQHTRAGNGFLQVGVDVGDLVAEQRVGARGVRAKDQRRGDQRGEDRQRRRGEARVQREQDDHGADEREAVGDERRDAVGDELVERVDVVRQARDDPAGLLPAEEVERQLLDVREQRAPQVEHDALSHPAHQIGLQVAGDEVDHADRDEEHDDHVDDVHIAFGDAGVDGDLDEVRHGQSAEGDGDHRDDAQGGAQAIGVGEAREP